MTVIDPHLPSPTQGFAMQQLAGHCSPLRRPLKRSSGAKGRFPPKFEAEMPSPFASSSSAISAAEACGATLEAVLRSRNLRGPHGVVLGFIREGRDLVATAH